MIADNNIRGGSGGGGPEFKERGYSIIHEKEDVLRFMEDGDYSSAKSLGLFEKIGSDLDDRIKKLQGASLFAFSISDERISRDFSVLHIAHFLSKRGRSVIVVDCDFLLPGLSGLVESNEEQGFLDLLLYGSSLKSVAKPTGIDGVSVISAGSFPVSRTVPFAKKEFSRVNDFLRGRSDVVIYCSTLYTEDGELNPLSQYVDGVILAFRIEDTEEGQVQSIHAALRSMGTSDVESICFCAGRDDAGEVSEEIIVPEKEEPYEEAEEVIETPAEEEEPAILVEEEVDSTIIEKTDEIEVGEEASKKGLNIFRITTIIAAVLVVAFIAWWFLVHRSIMENDRSERISEAVQDIREAGRDMTAEKTEEAPSEEAQDLISGEKAEDDKEPSASVPSGEAEKANEPAEGESTDEGIKKEEEAAVKEEDSAGDEGTSAEEESTGDAAAKASDYYSVHIASFRDINRAGLEAEYFENEGYKVEVREVLVKGDKWFRVMVGRFADEEEARRERIELLSYKRIGYARVVKTSGKSENR